jgi:nitrate reductase NapE component
MSEPLPASVPRANQAFFEGLMLASLAYGALVMLYIQVTQVLVRRPRRGRLFWFIVFYSTALFPLITIAFIGKFKFVEQFYVDQGGSVGAYLKNNASQRSNVLSQICVTLVPWFGDVLMLYRVLVLWNFKWALIVLPAAIYLSRVAMSIPLLISQTRQVPGLNAEAYGRVFYILCVSLNLMCTFLISLRLFMIRHKAERVLGSLQASLYNSSITMFVESGAFFTFWSITYLILKLKKSWAQDIFLQPYSYVLALTRMLIILRMAQDRAWSKELIIAADTGVLDWEVSSINSSSLNVSKPPGGSEQKLPNKFREDALSSRSTC